MQVVPVEELSNIAIRVIQAPSVTQNAVPDNVVWFDLQVIPTHQSLIGPSAAFFMALMTAQRLWTSAN